MTPEESRAFPLTLCQIPTTNRWVGVLGEGRDTEEKPSGGTNAVDEAAPPRRADWEALPNVSASTFATPDTSGGWMEKKVPSARAASAAITLASTAEKTDVYTL